MLCGVFLFPRVVGPFWFFKQGKRFPVGGVSHHDFVVTSKGTVKTVAITTTFTNYTDPRRTRGYFGPSKVPIGRSTQLATVSTVIRGCVKRNCFPNTAVIITHNNGVICRGSCKCTVLGSVNIHLSSPHPVRVGAVFSVTSYAGVVTAARSVVGLCDRKGVSLSTAMTDCVPRFTGGNGRGIAIRRLLARASNLPR